MRSELRPRIAFIGVGVIGGGPRGFGVPVLFALMERLCLHFDVSLYSLIPIEEKRKKPENFSVHFTSGNALISKKVKYVFLLMKLVFDHVRRPFSLFVSVSTFPAGRIAIVIGKILGRPVVVQLIADEMVAFPEIGYGELLRPKLKKINQWVCDSASELIVLTEYQKKLVQKNLKQNREIKVLPLRIDLSLFQYRENPLTSPIRFIHVGYFHPVKDQLNLFRVFSKVREKLDCSLTVVGEGFDVKEVGDLLALLDIKKNVSFTGTIPHDQLWPLLSQAHVLIHTSVYEAECAVVMEAMATGVVVCGTSVGFLADHGKEFAVVVEPGNPVVMSEAILRLVDSPERWHRMQKSARKYIEEYSADWSTKGYVALFNSIVKSQI